MNISTTTGTCNVDPARKSTTARGRRCSTPTTLVVATPDDSPAFMCATAGWRDGDDDDDGDYDACHDVMQAAQLPAPHASDDQDDDEGSVFDSDDDDDGDKDDRRVPFAADRRAAQCSPARSYERALVDKSHSDDMEEVEEGLWAVSRRSRLCHAPVETWIDRRTPLGRGFSEPPLMTLDQRSPTLQSTHSW